MSGSDQQVPGPQAVPNGLTRETLQLLRGVLDRHKAQVKPLPEQAGKAYSTVYRSGVLQIPEEDLVGRPSLVDELNRILAGTGHSLVEFEPQPPQGSSSGSHAGPRSRFPKRAHRRVRLVTTTAATEAAAALAADGGAAAQSVDAWEALNALRESVQRNDVDDGLRDAVNRIELEHLLFGAGVNPAPPGPSTEGHPATVSFPWPGSGGHTPVTLVDRAAPMRRPIGDIPGGRRPLIAVLDTGIGGHPWLREAGGPAAGSSSSSSDSFVLDDEELQEWIDIDEIDDGPDYGHGTFIAGIIRQACPDARVLNIRVMHDDGVVRQHDLTLALAGVLERNQAIQADLAAGKETDTSKFVDVVSLSAGYYPEDSEHAYTSRLFALLKELSECGVLIVASAGNDSTDVPCYPAGMRFDVPGTPQDQDKPPVVLSVGALDPDGMRAPFSNFGPWVKSWAAGAALVSTMPVRGLSNRNAVEDDARNTLVAPAKQPPRDRVPHGPGEYDGGFALWSGTSFAAPLVAAEMAGALIAVAAANGEMGMGQVDQKKTLERARAAFASVRAERAPSV
jgi:subtilisin family serine protease